MKVKVRKFRDAAYHAALDIYKEEVHINDFWEEFTGEIIATDVEHNMFLICRDDNGKFEKVKCYDCYKQSDEI